jgi:hypothetical protein
VPLWPVIIHTVVTSTFAEGYVFEKNIETGNIDMSHRTKPFNGSEKIDIYRNCTFLSLTNKLGEVPRAQEELVLLLTSQYRCVLFTIKLLHKCFELLCSLLMSFG